MEMKQIRMGIVGAGTWGETHASIYAEHLVCGSGGHLRHE